MTARSALRNAVAGVTRTLPSVRGKWHAARLLQRLLVDERDERTCLVTFRMRDGSRMRVDLRSPGESPAFWAGDYERRLLTPFLSCVRPGAVALDVGANIGFYAIALGRRLAPSGGTVYAFEPITANHERLVHNIELNGLAGTVRTLRVALGDREGTVDLARMGPDHASTGSAVMLDAACSGGAADSARLATLDTVAAEEEIGTCDLVKADIEGGELAFLRGGERFLREHRPVVYVELNAYWMEQFSWRFSDVRELAESWGYSLYRRDRNRFLLEDAGRDGDADIVLVPNEGPLATLARAALRIR